MSKDEGHGHEHEKLVKLTLYLEEDHFEAQEIVARECSKLLSQRWTKGAVVMLALSDFFSRRCEMTWM